MVTEGSHQEDSLWRECAVRPGAKEEWSVTRRKGISEAGDNMKWCQQGGLSKPAPATVMGPEPDCNCNCNCSRVRPPSPPLASTLEERELVSDRKESGTEGADTLRILSSPPPSHSRCPSLSPVQAHSREFKSIERTIFSIL